MRTSLCLSLAIVLCASGAALARSKKKRDDESGTKPAAASVQRPDGGLVSLTVVCATPGASIFVDGEMIGLSPMDLPVPVTPGDHSLKVTRLGFAPYIDVFSTKGKKEVRLEIELVPVSGVLHVKSNVLSARVLVDGKYVGDAPLEVEADVGPRAVQVSKPGYKDFFQNVMAVAGQESALDVNLEELPEGLNPYKPVPAPPPRWYQKPWVWGVIAGAAAVAAGATVGIVYGTKPYDLAGKGDLHCYDLGGGGASCNK